MTGFQDDAHAFVSGNEGKGWFDWPVSIDGVDVGVADAAGPHLHQDFVRLRIAEGDFFETQLLLTLSCDCAYSCDGHRILRILKKACELISEVIEPCQPGVAMPGWPRSSKLSNAHKDLSASSQLCRSHRSDLLPWPGNGQYRAFGLS